MTTFQHLSKKVEKFCQQSEDFSMRVPQVVQKRLSLIAQQNPLNNAKEIKEVERMVIEKPIAFFESWQQMTLQSWVAQQNISSLFLSNWLKWSLGQPVSVEHFFYQTNQEALQILEKGLQPIYSRVAANARRLR